MVCTDPTDFFIQNYFLGLTILYISLETLNIGYTFMKNIKVYMIFIIY